MKITERDKILLVLLVVILIVALAVVLPGVGVMACREKLAQYATDTEDVEKDLTEKLAILREMGVKASDAESVSRAKSSLEEDIFNMKVEASHLAGNVMAYAKPYAVDEGWVDGLEYRYGVNSDVDQKLVDYSAINDVDAIGGQLDETFVIGDVTYTLPSAQREIKYTISATANCAYKVEMTMDAAGYSAEHLGAVMLFLHNIANKGSMLITDFKCFTKQQSERSVSFTLLMPPEGSGISRYAQEVREELERRAAEEEEEEE